MKNVSCNFATSLVFLCLLVGFTCVSALASELEFVGKSTVDEKALTFASGPSTRWSTTVNGRSHQQTPLTTSRGFQYATWFNAERRVSIGRRKLPNGPWEVIQFKDHKIEVNDSHNTTVIGICDKDGTIHLAFDHHASPLNYRVSAVGAAHDPESVKWTADLFGPITHSLGSVIAHQSCTYPRFFPAPNGNLMLYYRAVTSGNGDGMIEEYDGDKHDWTPGLGRFIARDIGTYTFRGKTSQFRNPYMNSLSYAGERLHASWVWRDRFEKTNPFNQHDLCYAYSDDHGRTWMNSAGKLIGTTGKDFIHLDSPGLVVTPISSGSGLANSNTHFAYADGSIHVVARRRMEGASESRYYHYWRSAAGSWHNEMLPCTGSRPKLVGAADRSLILVYNDEGKDDKEWLYVAKGQPNANQDRWQWGKVKLPEPVSIGGEPLVDLERWKKHNVLSIYLQEVSSREVKTNIRGPQDGVPSPLYVLDFRLIEDAP